MSEFIVWQYCVWATGLVALAWLAQKYKVRAEVLAEEVLEAYAWVDEIIEALENPEEPGSDERVDSLVAERRPVQ